MRISHKAVLSHYEVLPDLPVLENMVRPNYLLAPKE
jgi:hypothetical protein